MMARCILALALALLLGLFPVVGAAAGQEPVALWRENLRLTAEYSLARKPTMFYVLDLEARRIMLRARGMNLREIPIAALGIWGRPLPISVHRVAQKDALSQPVRPAITPGEEKSAAQLDDSILELNDMPTFYRIGLENGIEILILPVAESFMARFLEQFTLLRWRLTRPLLTLRDRRERKESTSLYLVLKAHDAQSLYWSFYEGLEGVVVPPLR